MCVALSLLLLAGCSPRHDDAASESSAARDTLTERQRDSVIGASKLPGAKAVNKALQAEDAAAAHNAAIDSANAEMER
jgi:hypothetical protein